MATEEQTFVLWILLMSSEFESIPSAEYMLDMYF